MIRTILVSLCTLFSLSFSMAQVASVQSGDWNDPNTWDCACIPNSGNGLISIFHDVDVSNAATTASEIYVEAGVIFTILNGATLSVSTSLEAYNDGFDVGFVDVYGTLVGLNGVTFTGIDELSTTFQSTGRYRHLYTTAEGILPLANWLTGSTIEIAGYNNTVTASAAGNWSQQFYNVVVNLTSLSNPRFFDFNGQLTTVNGNLTVQSTGTGSVRFNGDLSVSGDLIISGSSRALLIGTSPATISISGNFLYQSSGTSNLTTTQNPATLNIAGNMSMSSGTLTLAGTGLAVINLSGDLSLTGGSTLNLATSNGGSGTVNVTGNVSLNSVSISRSNNATLGLIRFNGSSPQVYSNSGATFSNNPLRFEVASSATVNLGTSVLGGNNNVFVCDGRIELGSTNPTGAIQGNILATTRTFNSGSTIAFAGSAAQFIGTGYPSSSGVTAVIANASGVSLAGSVVIGGNLVLENGNLNVGNNTLTLGGNVTANSNFVTVTPSSSLIINGTGPLGIFPFPAGDQTITNFTLNRISSGSITFSNNVTISGATSLTAGNLIFSGRTLSLSGTFVATSGALFSDASSTLTIGGTAAFGELVFATGGNILNTLNFSRSAGTASLDNSLTITNALNLLDGDFTNTSGLSLSNGATLTRNSTAQLLGTNIDQGPGEFYNVIYNGTLSTGIELPTAIDNNLNNLTIASGPVTLTQNIIVNGNLNLQNSTFNANSFNIIMAGNPGVWNRQTGSFNPGTGTVFISGNISVQAPSAAPQFGNLIVNSGATFTARAGVMNISGNLQIDAASTFNHNGGTLTFNGSTNQGFAGAGKNFNNLTVNKTGGNLQLTSAVNLINTLDVLSATTIDSNGSLRLLSTSDGTSGNARIGSLPAGASITGNVTVQRFISDEGRIYRYLTSPVSGFTVAQLQSNGLFVTGSFTGSSVCSGCTVNPSMFAYDEAVAGVVDNGYSQFPVSTNSEALQVGRGYAPFVRDDIIPGNLNINWLGTVNQGSIALPVTFTNSGDASADGYNLVGNPFPSSIDWDNLSGWTKTNVSPTITVRDNGAGGVYRTWDGAVGDLANGQIATGQAFWVRTTATSPALIVNEQAKTSATATLYRQNNDEPLDYLKISLSQGSITDNTYIRYRAEALNILDEFDGPKLNNASFDVYSLSEEGIPMALNAISDISCSQSHKLGIKDMPNGTFNFAVERVGFFEQFDFYLLDSFTQTVTRLSPGSIHEFITTSDPNSKSENRFTFELKLTEPVKLEVIDGILHSNYESGNSWYRNGQLIEGETKSIYTPEMPGLYTLKVKIGTCEFGAPESYVITGAEGNGKKSIRVFPNPFKNRVKLEVDSSNPVSVRLLNSLGVEIESRQLPEQSFTKHTEFDLSGQSNGMYILHVVKDGQMHLVKIIKTNE